MLWVPQCILLGPSVQKGTGSSEGLVSHVSASCGLLVYAKLSEVCHLGAVLGLVISGVFLVCHSSWSFITMCPCVEQRSASLEVLGAGAHLDTHKDAQM